MFRLHGSNTVGERLAPNLVSAWLQRDGFDRIAIEKQADLEHTVTGSHSSGQSLTVRIHAHGSSTSFRDLASGEADIGMSSRRIRPEEVSALAELGKLDDSRHEIVIGIDGIAVIVHPENPIQALSIEQLRYVFSGQVTDWVELGGEPGPIKIYARDEKSGTFDSFDSMVMAGREMANSATRLESSSELSDRVSRDSSAIGFIGLPYIRDAKALAVSSGDVEVPPEPFSSATEDYPLSRRLYLYLTDNALNGPAGDFAQFVISDSGQRIVDETGFVGQVIEVREIEPPPNAPEEYRSFVDGAYRASLNIRFEQGLADLDSKAQRDIQRLAAFMRKHQNQHYRLMLMGFSDPHETSAYFALSLSIDRVDSVARHLLLQDVPVFRARGFGGALPLTNSTGSLGAVKNRRVEVWLSPNATGNPVF